MSEEWSIVVSSDELSPLWKRRLVNAAQNKLIKIERMPLGVKLIGLTDDGRHLISELGATLEP